MSMYETIAFAGFAVVVALLVFWIIDAKRKTSLQSKRLSELISELSDLNIQKEKLDQHALGLEKLREDLIKEIERLTDRKNKAHFPLHSPYL